MLFIILILIIFIIIFVVIYIINITNANILSIECKLPVECKLGIPSGFKFWFQNSVPQTLSYNYITNTPYQITDKIREFMYRFRNTKLNEIILGNGSIQIINAYFYSVKQILGNVKLYHINPTFYIINNIAKTYNIEITDNPKNANLEYICVINNPDGKIIYSHTNAKYKLYDYAYWYDGFTLVNKPYLPENVDFTFSFSKFGLSGFRLGFLNLISVEILSYITSYMFFSTININSASYDYFITSFKDMNDINYRLNLHTNEMKRRWNALNFINKNINEIINYQGGYILMKFPPSYYEKKNIIGNPIIYNNITLTRLNIMGDNFNCLIKQLK